jgi:hypothetical protein
MQFIGQLVRRPARGRTGPRADESNAALPAPATECLINLPWRDNDAMAKHGTIIT